MVEVRGIDVDAQTRCAHYNSAVDVIAIKMRCCGEYFACKDCHDALADHPLEPWPSGERAEPAVFCGVCRSELTVERYLASSTRCSSCGTSFNPGCRDHHHFYFTEAVVTIFDGKGL